MENTLRPVESVPFQATEYPITVAEVPQASEMLDELLGDEQRDELVDCLAFQPDIGEPLGDCSRVRTNVFAFDTVGGKSEVTVVYFFHDLNMPLYILAVYEGEKEFSPDSLEEETMNRLAAELVQTSIKDARRAFKSSARS
ncbi:hypothetical protein [Shimia biformata]|uniref:hypothetical protein n=1 Tax=Shimia biformata TaxID=1294299 RepID=UPI001951B5CA|nr:hypothetical protein [Shimia biformata]